MFQKINKFKTHHQMLFALIIGFSVVSFWRGVWGIMDIYVFPGNYELSSWISLVIGLAVLYATHYVMKELT